MLNENPKERPSFAFIADNYEPIMKRDDHIRMVEGQSKEDKKMSISQRKLHGIHWEDGFIFRFWIIWRRN